MILVDTNILVAASSEKDVHHRASGLGGTDASLVAVAERTKTVQVATFDRRHFTVVRPQHVEALTLLP